MKKILVAGIAAAACCGAPALAADMPVKAIAAAPLFNWTGCYIGGNTGGVWAAKKYNWTTQTGVSTGGLNAGSLSADSWAYGGQIGCDYQVNNYLVVGIRGMLDGTNLHGSNVFPVATALSNNLKIDSFETVVGKLGVLLTPAVELYGVAGVASVRDQYSVLGGAPASANQPRTGYDVGGGLTLMLARNWDLFVEYDYMGFGTKNVTEGTFGMDIRQHVSKALLGIDYRFDWGKAPIIAKD